MQTSHETVTLPGGIETIGTPEGRWQKLNDKWTRLRDFIVGLISGLTASLGTLCRRGVSSLRFRLGMLRLKAQAALVPLRGSRLWRELTRAGRTLADLAGKIKLGWGLAVCAVVTAAALVLSMLVQGVPALRGLDGAHLPAENLVLLDPMRRDEAMLAPGFLYDRPIAAAQTGAQPLVLRARLEETLLAIRKDGKGLVVAPVASLAPGENYTPRTVTRETALRMLVDGGYCAKDASWAQAARQKLPAKRLPESAASYENLLIFEKKTVENPFDSSIDLSSLLPEDLAAMGLNKATYSHIGFYDLGEGVYQPLFLTVEDSQSVEQPPVITKISYQYYVWDEMERKARLFDDAGEHAVLFGMPGLRPLREWREPAAAWFYDEDGWVYYGDVLRAGEMTPLLLSNYYVLEDSPLAGVEENRFRLEVRCQSIALDLKAKDAYAVNQGAILSVWDTHAELGGIGTNQMSQTAAAFADGLLRAMGMGVNA